MTTATLPPLTKKDFQTDQEVRWCPGCGDYSILSAVQAVFPELGIKRENFVVVSGIGCSRDRKSTRLNSSHLVISYAVFCLKKKKKEYRPYPVLHTDT